MNLKVLTWILSSFPLKLSENLKPKTVSNFPACVAGEISRANAFVLTGGEAVKASGETERIGEESSGVSLAASPLANILVCEGIWRPRGRSLASRKLRRLQITRVS